MFQVAAQSTMVGSDKREKNEEFYVSRGKTWCSMSQVNQAHGTLHIQKRRKNYQHIFFLKKKTQLKRETDSVQGPRPNSMTKRVVLIGDILYVYVLLKL